MIFFQNDTADPPGCQVDGHRTAVQTTTNDDSISRNTIHPFTQIK